MSLVVPPDVEALVAQQVASGRYPSEGDVLRSAMHALTEIDEDLAAVQEALAEWRAGDPGVPLDEAIRAVRTRSASGAEA
jgi:putative addiction module CopG family antidote